jgi:hypothetical protein
MESSLNSDEAAINLTMPAAAAGKGQLVQVTLSVKRKKA